MQKSATQHRKRRKAVPRRTLSRERILTEALTLLDKEGARALGMRRLADHLGVTPMALYNHVRSKQDLLQGVVATVIDRIDYPDEGGDWRDRIRGCFRAMRAACLAYPGIVPLIESADVLPASIFRPMEITVSALRKAGIAPTDAVRAYYLLVTFTVGQVSYQIRGWGRGVDPVDAVQRGRIPTEKFPNVAVASSGRDWDFAASFEFGLSVVLAGLERQPKRWPSP
jgi:TetR/AcrR family tetracycline transcriptional repressor